MEHKIQANFDIGRVGVRWVEYFLVDWNEFSETPEHHGAALKAFESFLHDFAAATNMRLLHWAAIGVSEAETSGVYEARRQPTKGNKIDLSVLCAWHCR